MCKFSLYLIMCFCVCFGIPPPPPPTHTHTHTLTFLSIITKGELTKTHPPLTPSSFFYECKRCIKPTYTCIHLTHILTQPHTHKHPQIHTHKHTDTHTGFSCQLTNQRSLTSTCETFFFFFCSFFLFSFNTTFSLLCATFLM